MQFPKRNVNHTNFIGVFVKFFFRVMPLMRVVRAVSSQPTPTQEPQHLEICKQGGVLISASTNSTRLTLKRTHAPNPNISDLALPGLNRVPVPPHLTEIEIGDQDPTPYTGGTLLNKTSHNRPKTTKNNQKRSNFDHLVNPKLLHAS